jgi:prophage regulatory protein
MSIKEIPQPDPVLRVREVAARCGIGVSTVWKWAASGKLPPPFNLSSRCTVWRASAIDAFLRRAEEAGRG